MQHLRRRMLLRSLWLLPSVFGFFSVRGWSKTACKPTDIDPKLVEFKGLDSKKPDPKASQYGYYSAASKVDAKKFPKRKLPEGKNQSCVTCQLYQVCKTKQKNTGGCQILPGMSVKGEGWCNLWMKKA